MQNSVTPDPMPFDAYLHRPLFELFDLEQDPDEVVNLAQQSEYASLHVKVFNKRNIGKYALAIGKKERFTSALQAATSLEDLLADQALRA